MTTDLEARISDLEKRVSALEKGPHADSAGIRGKKPNLSVNEFLREKRVISATSAVNLVLAIAVYNERFRGADSVSANNLRDLIREAKQKSPTNINDCINRNVSKGYIAEDKFGEDRKKRWYVTTSGNDYVDSNFKDNEQNT